MSRLTANAASRQPARWSLGATVELVACILLAVVLAATLNLGLAAVACCPLGARLAGDRLALLYCAGAAIFGGVVAQVLLSALSVASPFGFSQLVFSIHF